MSRTKTTFARRALASVGAAALGLMGVVGLSTSAFADENEGGGEAPPTEVELGNIDFAREGSLTLNKLVSANPGNAGNGGTGTVEGLPLNGVEFTLYKCANDMTDPAQWQALSTMVVGDCVEPDVISAKDTGSGDFADGQIVWEHLAVGLYKVVETEKPGVSGAAPFLVTIPYNTSGTWNYDVVVYPKNTITGEGDKVLTGVDAPKPGAKASWKLTSPVLGSADFPANSIKLEVDDNIGTFMTFNKDATLKVIDPDTQEATTIDGQPEVSNTGTTYTFTYNFGNTTYNAGTVFVIEYSTTITGSPESGKVENNSDWGWDAAYWGKVRVDKVDKDSEKALDGAKFAVYAGACPTTQNELGMALYTDSTTDGTWTSGWLLVAEGKGNATAEAEYCVVETAAPQGYVLPDYSDRSWTVDVSAGAATDVTAEPIVNTKTQGPTLPVTGASGTMLMTMGGIGLVAVAGGLYLATRRKAHQE